MCGRWCSVEPKKGKAIIVSTSDDPFLREVDDVEEANALLENGYRFVDLRRTNGKYVLKKRER